MSRNGKFPQEVQRETTDRLSLKLATAMSDAGNAPVAAAPEDSTTLVHQLAEKLHELQGKSSGGGGGGGGSFLGMKLGDLVKWAMGAIFAGAVAFGGWYLTVRDSLHERPTFLQVEKSLTTYDIQHSAHPHPGTEKKIESLTKEQQTIRESQIRQEGIAEKQAEALETIKEDLRYIKRRSQ